jgi:hypothetical protein
MRGKGELRKQGERGQPRKGGKRGKRDKRDKRSTIFTSSVFSNSVFSTSLIQSSKKDNRIKMPERQEGQEMREMQKMPESQERRENRDRQERQQRRERHEHDLVNNLQQFCLLRLADPVREVMQRRDLTYLCFACVLCNLFSHTWSTVGLESFGVMCIFSAMVVSREEDSALLGAR